MVRAYRPLNFQNALSIMQEIRVTPLAGGTDLMVSRRRWSGLSPLFNEPVLFIGHLEEMKKIESDTHDIRIGAGCSFSSILKNELVPEVLKIVLLHIASPAIRNRGTIGGNICNASPAGDTLPLLYALDASVIVERKGAARTLPIEKFIAGPGEVDLKADELLKEIIIPRKSFNIVFYRKVGTRRTNACSKLAFTGLAQTEWGKIVDIRISFGAVAPTIVRSREIEESLKEKTGKEIEKLVPAISRFYEGLLKPIDDQRSNINYRRIISLKLLRYFLQTELVSRIQ